MATRCCIPPVSSICPHSHHKSPATLAQSSDRITHHLMNTSDRGRTLKERIGHWLETQVTGSSWLLHSRDVGSTRFACMPHRCAFGSAWRFKKAWVHGVGKTSVVDIFSVSL